MNEPMNESSDRRSSSEAESGETLAPEIVKLLLLCGADVREADRTTVTSPNEATSRRGGDRRDGDRRHLERRFSERRHDERRAA
jgi:hypothetical protein